MSEAGSRSTLLPLFPPLFWKNFFVFFCLREQNQLRPSLEMNSDWLPVSPMGIIHVKQIQLRPSLEMQPVFFQPSKTGRTLILGEIGHMLNDGIH